MVAIEDFLDWTDRTKAAHSPRARCGTPVSGSLQTGKRIGGYVLQRELAASRMSSVWRAHDLSLDRSVVLKFAADRRPDMACRLIREARVLARLHDPCLPRLLGSGFHRERPYLVLQYIEGKPLDRIELSVEQAAAAVRDAARVLARVHRSGYVHRDVKPNNLLLSAQGKLYVLDLGLVKRQPSQSGETVSITESGLVLGTPEYLSPEQARGDIDSVDSRTDVYALGATLYQLVTGRAPFVGSDLMEVLGAVLAARLDPPSRIRRGLPRALESIILRAMSPEMNARYSGATEMADDLDHYLERRSLRAAGRCVRELAHRLGRSPVFWSLAGGVAGTVLGSLVS